MEELIDNLCDKLHCTQLADDLEKLDYVREMLLRVQQQELFYRVLGPDDYLDDLDETHDENVLRMDRASRATQRSRSTAPPGRGQSTFISEQTDRTDRTDQTEAVAQEEELPDEECISYLGEKVNFDLPEDAWHGFFKGYQILSEAEEFSLSENKKCIELTPNDCDESLDAYLRSGVRCFVIDLFTGNDNDNQTLIVRLRESELQLSKEIGFPVTSTLFAKLSPRLQYTGVMDPPDMEVMLEKGDRITLHTDRILSFRGSKKRTYVNARFLIDDVEPCDCLLVGPDIQLFVQRKKEGRLKCVVLEGGILKSRLPVLFPGKCNKFRLSLEELEDITFAKEVGINVIVSYIAGSVEYLDNLQECLRLLQCDKMRLFARVVLNELRGCRDEMNWAADRYDGFIIELSVSEKNPDIDIMHLCPAAASFIKRVYDQKKPIIFDPLVIAQKRLVIDPEHFLPIFYYPDRYLVKCDRSRSSFYFYFLQNSLCRTMPQEQLSHLPYCDKSLTGSDSLARSTVSASFEMNAAVIFVVSLTGRMAAKIAHYRPHAPIIFITRMRSAEKFISLYHHVTMLCYRGKCETSHRRAVYKHLLFGLLYAKSRRILRHNDNVIFVYGSEEGTKCPDKYMAYKFNEKDFPTHLSKTLFTMHTINIFRKSKPAT